MNEYKQQLDSLPFDPDFKEKTIRLMRANAPEKAPRFTKKIWRVGLIAAALILLTTLTAVAANLLTAPDEVADRLNSAIRSPDFPEAYHSVAEAFRSEDALILNEQHEMGDFIVTLEGIVTGEDIGVGFDTPDPFGRDTSDRSCIAVAVRYKDGRHLEWNDIGLDKDPIGFVQVHPFVQGYDPCSDTQFNFPTDTGLALIDDVYYLLVMTGDLTHLPGKKIYITVYANEEPFLHLWEETTPFSMDGDGAFALNERAEEIPATIFEVDLNGD